MLGILDFLKALVYQTREIRWLLLHLALLFTVVRLCWKLLRLQKETSSPHDESYLELLPLGNTSSNGALMYQVIDLATSVNDATMQDDG